MIIYSKKTRMEHLSESDSVLNATRIQEPSFQYFSSVYMTLLSVIQGLIFSVSVMPFFDEVFSGNFDIALLFLPTLTFAVLLWDNYVSHHQFIGWQINYVDTLIIMGYGVMEAIAVSIPIVLIENTKAMHNEQLHGVVKPYVPIAITCIQSIGPLNLVMGMIILCAVLGIYSYHRAMLNAQAPYIKAVLIKKYDEKMYFVIVGIEKRMKNITKIAVYILVIGLVLFNCLRRFVGYINIMSDMMAISFAVIFLVLLRIYDIKRLIEREENGRIIFRNI